MMAYLVANAVAAAVVIVVVVVAVAHVSTDVAVVVLNDATMNTVY